MSKTPDKRVVVIGDCYPLVALSKPGTPATVRIELINGADTTEGWIEAQLLDNGCSVGVSRERVEISRDCSQHDLVLQLPVEGPRGYQVAVRVEHPGGEESSLTALLAANHWREAPRYGFLSEFGLDRPQAWRIQELAKYKITMVQFYDWMYRHYCFVPPQDEFEDAMGRRLSLATVRERIEECHARGISAIAYGAVYGPEPELTDEHPDWVLRDGDGQELSLIDLFYITDLRSGSSWRKHILGEFERAVRELGFDGIHMDQYGFPKWSYAASGEAVDLAECFAEVINEAGELLRDRYEAGVVFNAVNAWPLERVACTHQEAVYIEVWPPHERYRDLVDLIRRGRDLSGKQVVLAAYLEPFREGGEGAENGALLATAVIAAAGGFHLLLGEGDAVLRDPYYPNHGRLTPTFVRRLRRYYDHSAAFHHYLFGPDLLDVTTSYVGGVNSEVSLEGPAFSPHPDSGTVWLSVKKSGARLVVNLVNLSAAKEDGWNRAKDEPEPVSGAVLRLSRHFRVRRAAWASPDGETPARELDWRRVEAGPEADLPPLRYWATVVIDLE